MTSDQLLRTMHRVLRPVDAAHVALVAPLEPSMGAAALQLEGREIAVVTPAGRRWLEESGSQGGHHYVWCRDELEADGVRRASGDPRLRRDGRRAGLGAGAAADR